MTTTERIADENERTEIARRVLTLDTRGWPFRLRGQTLLFRVESVYTILDGVPCVSGRSEDGRITHSRIADTSLID